MSLAPELIEGDCLEVMARLEAASFDAIITDPPYGLAFMGAHWDHGIPGVDFWREALRILKPGGHLAAFGGTRTEHRLVCAIEDAGFEIRDKLMWLYGSGFPKSTNVSKQIDKGFRRDETGGDFEWSPASGPAEGVYEITAFVRAARDLAGKSNREIDELFGFHGMAGHWTSSASQPAVPTWPQWEKLKAFLAFGDSMDEAVLAINGGKGDRSLEGTAFAERPVVGTKQGKDASAGDLFAPGGGRYIPKEYDVTEAATAAAQAWEGWGTTLKPAWEPIALARRPLVGTIANNVLRYGVGGLNVKSGRLDSGPVAGQIESGPDFVAEGRWPPNVAIAPEVAAEIDKQSGESESRRATLTSKPGLVYGGGNGLPAHTSVAGYDDFGGASRFFYCAKASRAEREEGLVGLPLRAFSQSLNGAEAEDETADWAFGGPGGIGFDAIKHVRNHHPTVKPVSLMRWLVRLLVRPGARILDPFAGSGTTGIAAYAEEVKAVLIEKEPPFAEIARRRMAHHSRQPSLWEET